MKERTSLIATGCIALPVGLSVSLAMYFLDVRIGKIAAYPFLVLAAYGLFFLAKAIAPRTRWLAVAVSLAFVFAWARSDTFGASSTGQHGAQLEDRVTTFGGRVVYRRATVQLPGGHYVSSCGQLDNLGQPHGRWRRYDSRTDETVDDWWWHGELVSEETWRLLT